MDTKQQGHLAGLLKLTRQLSSTPPSDTGTTTSVVGRCPAALLRGWSFAQAARDTFGRFSCTAKLRWTMRERGAENTVSGWPRPNAQPRDERAANHMGKCSAHKNDTYACAAHTWRTARGVSAYGSGRWRERAQLAPFSPLSATAPPPPPPGEHALIVQGKSCQIHSLKMYLIVFSATVYFQGKSNNNTTNTNNTLVNLSKIKYNKITNTWKVLTEFDFRSVVFCVIRVFHILIFIIINTIVIFDC